jgi:hypothetical protein
MLTSEPLTAEAVPDWMLPKPDAEGKWPNFQDATGELLPLPLVDTPVWVIRRVDSVRVGLGCITAVHADGTANVMAEWDTDPDGPTSHLAGVAHPRQLPHVPQHPWFAWLPLP